MKVIHLVIEDLTGGAGRATFRLNRALNSTIKSKMIVAKKSSADSNVKNYMSNRRRKILSMIKLKINNLYKIKYKVNSIFSNNVLGVNILNDIDVKEADIINIHWINSGMISYKTIKKMKELNKPIIWTCHDMWPFTGGCHYDEGCEGYRKGCGNCKILNSKNKKDLSSRILKKKKNIYNDINLTVVGCSRWITECANESTVLKNKECINIPNCIDIDIFKPISKELAKQILNIMTEKKIILFGAMSSTSDKRKGFEYLLKAIKTLDKDRYIAIIFGNSSEESEIEEYIETIYMGKVVDDYTLSLLYSSADIFVAPSIQENLANTVMESLACGTPVVAFDIGGMPDMIKHKENGYLVEPFKYESLANGITYCTNNTVTLGKEARKYVESNFTYEIIGKRYTELYRNLIDRKENR